LKKRTHRHTEYSNAIGDLIKPVSSDGKLSWKCYRFSVIQAMAEFRSLWNVGSPERCEPVL